MTEQELILTSLLRCQRVELYVRRFLLTAEQRERVAQIKKRRRLGEPLQYLLGEWEFLGFPFKVDTRALIPRPETELLVETVLEKAKLAGDEPLKILDIGTGCGNIAISLAKSIPLVHITAMDVSADALSLAQENARLNQVEDKITFINTCVFDFLKTADAEENSFDMIVSNPPYVPTEKMKDLPRDVLREPHLALDGGPEGLKFLQEIISEGVPFLKPEGFLFLEIGDGQEEKLQESFLKSRAYGSLYFRNDYAGTARVAIARRKNFSVNS